jgi:hypothetical protein
VEHLSSFTINIGPSWPAAFNSGVSAAVARVVMFSAGPIILLDSGQLPQLLLAGWTK